MGRAILPTALALILAVSCSPSTSSPEHASDLDACLRSAGVSIEEVGPPPEGRIPDDSPWADPTVQGAYLRCLEDTGAAEIEGDDPDEVEEATAKALAMSECLASRGWDVPELERHPVWGYLLPAFPEMPEDLAGQQALIDDMKECGQSAGIPVEGSLEP